MLRNRGQHNHDALTCPPVPVSFFPHGFTNLLRKFRENKLILRPYNVFKYFAIPHSVQLLFHENKAYFAVELLFKQNKFPVAVSNTKLEFKVVAPSTQMKQDGGSQDKKKGSDPFFAGL